MKISYGKEKMEKSHSESIYLVPLQTALIQRKATICKVEQRPVDIVVGTVSRFEARKEIPSIENEVYRKGVLLYDETSQRVV